MEIFLIIILLILVVANYTALFHSLKQMKKPEVKETEKKPRLTKEEKEKQKKIRESFDNLMNYDETIARSRK